MSIAKIPFTRLIEDFEEEHYPIPDAPPHRILRFLMEQNDLRQSDLLQIFGSRGYVSDVVKGKRAISKTHAKALGKMFHVSPDVFIAGRDSRNSDEYFDTVFMTPYQSAEG